METLLIPNDLDRYALTILVISALQDLAERAFSQHRHDLVPVAQMIAFVIDVVASFVVIAVIIRGRVVLPFLLFGVLAGIPDGRVVKDFAAFVSRKSFEMCLDERCGIARRAVSAQLA